VLVASNPLVSNFLSAAIQTAGYERRGEVIRLVQTMRGGDRPKNAHEEFSDVSERELAPHPSLEPQAFLRQVVRAILPLGEGVVLDPFAGSGSTLAAAESVGYSSIGVEMDPAYLEVARKAIPALAGLSVAADSNGQGRASRLRVPVSRTRQAAMRRAARARG
jgi:DNA modification methylase